MNLTTQNGVKIISGSVDEFAIKMVNCAKKNVKNHKTYVNANFFAGFKESGEYLVTLGMKKKSHLLTQKELSKDMTNSLKLKIQIQSL